MSVSSSLRRHENARSFFPEVLTWNLDGIIVLGFRRGVWLSFKVPTLDINPEEYLREVFAFLPFMTNQTASDWRPAARKAPRNAAKG